MSAIGTNPIEMQLTHAMWVESGRWRVCETMPRLNTPEASTARARMEPGSRRRAQAPTPTRMPMAT